MPYAYVLLREAITWIDDPPRDLTSGMPPTPVRLVVSLASRLAEATGGSAVSILEGYTEELVR